MSLFPRMTSEKLPSLRRSILRQDRAFHAIAHALTREEVGKLSQQTPDFGSILFEEGSKPWPVQTRGQAAIARRKNLPPAARQRTVLKPVAAALSAAHARCKRAETSIGRSPTAGN